MRYCIERENRSVVIGHCKTPAIINDATIPYTLDEIGRRLKETKFADDGITYRYGDIDKLEPFDIVTLTNEDEVVTVGIRFGGYEILGRRDRVEGLESE